MIREELIKQCLMYLRMLVIVFKEKSLMLGLWGCSEKRKANYSRNS